MPVEGYPIYSKNFTKEYKENYDSIRWDNPTLKEEEQEENKTKGDYENHLCDSR